MPSSSSPACKKCKTLQERVKQLESELRAAKQEPTSYKGRRGARTYRAHNQQLIEGPREQDLLINLEQQPNQQVDEVPLQQFDDQNMLTQLELHHHQQIQHQQQQQHSMDIWAGSRSSDGAGSSTHRQKQQQQQQLMDQGVSNRSSDGAGSSTHGQKQNLQQQSMELTMCSTSSGGAGPSTHRQKKLQQQQSADLSMCNTSSGGAGPSNQHERELYEALEQETLKNDILKKLKELFNLILQQPQKPRREMLHYIRSFTQPQIMPRQQNQPSQPQKHPQQQHENPQPPQQQNQP